MPHMATKAQNGDQAAAGTSSCVHAHSFVEAGEVVVAALPVPGISSFFEGVVLGIYGV